MFKEDYKKLNERIMPGSELMKRTERSMKEIMNKKQAKHMSGKMALALALACVMTLTGVAFATGAIQSVFDWMKGLGIREEVDFDRLGELSESGLGMETEETEYNGQVSVELNQAYYDGYQLILGAKYRIGGNQAVVGLEHELMELTRPENEAFCAVRYEAGAMPLAIDQQGAIPEKSSLIPAYIAADMTDEQIQAFEEAYAENGEAGVVVYAADMSDHIPVREDVEEELCPQTDVWSNESDGSVWRYVDFGTLPESCREQDQLCVSFGVNQRATVVRADAEGVWVASVRMDKAEFSFEVERNGQETRFAYGSFENDVYSAKAELRMNGVSNRLIIDMVRPQEWTGADKEADFIRDYHVMYPDGTHEGVMDSKYPTDNNGYRMEGTISLQEGQTEVVLRPYYALTGLREGEDIILEIPSVK